MEERKNFRKIFIFAVIGISIVIIMYVGSQLIVRFQLSSCRRNIEVLQDALEDYYSSYNAYPTRLTLENLTYIKVLPKDPATGKNYIYEISEDRQHYRILCPNPKNHKVKKIEATELKKVEIIY